MARTEHPTRWLWIAFLILGGCQPPGGGQEGCEANPALCAGGDNDGEGNDGGSGSDDGEGEGGDDGGGSTGGGGPGAGLFPPQSIWYRDVSAAPIDAQSDEIIGWLERAGGWGNDGVFQIDFSIEVLRAGDGAPFREFEPTEDFYEPDCDAQPVPVPAGGALEGESGYACESDGDCHLIVVHEPTQRLFEMWRAHIEGDYFFGGCMAVWDLTRVYGPDGRGEQCTSADAAGYPIAALLFTADEVAAGEIAHAIRFILPNSRIREEIYVHPATHSTPATSGPDTAPPYGALLRLRGDYPLDDLPTGGARVVARALQRHGMYLADGGEIALTAQSDRFTAAKWDGLLGPHDLDALQVGDFDVLELGDLIPYTGDCTR